MPVPVEYNSVRRMSTINVPKQDINFDTYDFQLCVPQNDIKDTFESKDLEASFCRDFACCGLVLNDLHDLLQHYEECHVRLEEDENSLFDDESDAWSPSLSFSSLSSQASSMSSIADDCSTTSSVVDSLGDLDAIKKKAAAYLSDLYNCTTATSVSPLTPSLHGSQSSISSQSSFSSHSATSTSPTEDSETSHSTNEEQQQQQQQQQQQPPQTQSQPQPQQQQQQQPQTTQNTNKKSTASGKKRTYSQYAGSSPSALDLLTQSAAKKIATLNGDLPTPIFTEEDLLAQAGALLASANTIFNVDANADKPYKCPVHGCDKAYKNPNGLKYHNQHGHCNLMEEDSDSILSKPYQCTIGDCGKRYKNLNGLKYHIEHSHMAALNQTLASFSSSLFSNSTTTPLSTPSASVTSSPASSISSTFSSPMLHPASSNLMFNSCSSLF